MKLYEKHLKSIDEKKFRGGKEKEVAFKKVLKTIRSCKTLEQLENARGIIRAFMKNYGDTSRAEYEKEEYGIPSTGKYYNTIRSTMDDQKARISHLTKLK